MARQCQLCAKKPLAGRNTQHRRGGLWFNRAQRTIDRQNPNIQKKKIFIDGGASIKIKICTQCLKTLDKQAS